MLFCNQEELFSIQEDLTVTVHSKVSHTVQTQADPDSEVKHELKGKFIVHRVKDDVCNSTSDLMFFLQADPTANLTFNLHLSETEREAKEKVALPFVFSQEK